MSDDAVTLEFLARPLQRMIEEQRETREEIRSFRSDMAAFRDEMLIQTSMITRLDRARLHRDERDAETRDQVRAIREQLATLGERLRALESRD
jgi:septal ring factor EnvC (AmiA/AmiB activator)